MLLPEPPPTRWELHGQMLGADFRIHPLFWVSCALPGVVYYQYPSIREQIGGLVAFLLWMAAVLVSIGAHEIGHVLAARLFGARLRVFLSGFGDRLFGLEGLRRWQRLVVLLAGPLANAILFGIGWSVMFLPLPVEWRLFLAPGLWLLLWVNAFWCLLNLLPLWPLDGGRLAVELGDAVLGRRGQTLALLLSLAITVGLIVFVGLWMRVTLVNRFDPAYPVYFVYFCILALYCYAFWLSAFRALWGPAESIRQ